MRKSGIDWLSWGKHVHVCTSTYHITLHNSSNCMWLFYIVRLIMFPLWLAIVVIFYFLSDCWLWKLINIFYYSWKKKKETQLELALGRLKGSGNWDFPYQNPRTHFGCLLTWNLKSCDRMWPFPFYLCSLLSPVPRKLHETADSRSRLHPAFEEIPEWTKVHHVSLP